MFPQWSDIILMAHSTGKDTNTKQLIDSVVSLKYDSLPLGMLLSASALHLRTILNKKIKNCKKHTEHKKDREKMQEGSVMVWPQLRMSASAPAVSN